MDKDGYIRVGACVPEVRIADVEFNIKAIARIVEESESKGASVVVTPELGVTGYTCGDLFAQQSLMEEAERGLEMLVQASSGWRCIVAVGLPVRYKSSLYNCAALLYRGSILGIVPKSWLPNYGEFYEKRWFASGRDVQNSVINIAGCKDVPFGTGLLFGCGAFTIGVELCEDLWVPAPPSIFAALHGANVILNLSASNEVAGKYNYLRDLVCQQSGRLRCAYLYASAGFGESSSDLVYGGNGFIAENGKMLASTPRFGDAGKVVLADIDLQLLEHDRTVSGSFVTSADDEQRWQTVHVPFTPLESCDKLIRPIERHPFVPAPGDDKCVEIANIQTEGLRRRLTQLCWCPSVVGVSGGLDSTLALLVTAMAYDRAGRNRKDIYAITMPGFATSRRTKSNAVLMAEALGVTLVEIPIGSAAARHLEDIGHDGVTTDVTYENAQARERTQVLMDYANKVGGIVIGTGDLSELALGWCTYNGDHMSMYAVNASVPKTLVRHLVAWYGRELNDKRLAEVLADVLDTPVSPELIPAADGEEIAQLTEDLVGPYELHDFYLYQMVRNGFRPRKIRRLARQAFENDYPDAVIDKWLAVFVRRFFNQQFKRNCMPDAPKVGSVCLSPRGDWRMPSDACAAIWLNDLN